MSEIIPFSEYLNDFLQYTILAFIAAWILLSIVFKSRLASVYLSSLLLVSWTTIITVLLIEKNWDTFIVDRSEVENASFTNEQIIRLSLSLAGIMIVVIGIFTLFFRNRIAKPLVHVIKQTNKMADGDLVSEGDVVFKGTGETASLLHANRVLSNRFRTIVGNIRTSSESLATAAEELAASSEEVAATTEEVTGTIQTIAEGAAEQVKRLEEVSEVLNNMTKVIDESIRQISLTSKITLDLADQTNLVSLNAAIEAAKAGIEGQGFQVVANHVRELSIESKSASTRVNSITKNISMRMRDSVYEIVNAVDKIAGVAENTAASSEEAAAAAEEQAASLQEITRQAQKLASLSESSERSIGELRI